MANYNKSFNFRNGVQVDQDNFLVDSLGRVGIGTTIPRTDLDVYGNAAINGRLDTINSISSGIATFIGTVKVGTGITMYAASGIISATYYGDGSNLDGLPTSQWIDVNPSIYAYTSIYAAGNVGIATTNPAFTFQVGDNPNNPSGIGTAYGLGITSEGNVRTSGIITAKSFVGSGAGVTSINADNISAGTLSASLFSNINSSGIATIGTLGVTGTSTTRNLQVTGVTTVGFITATSLYVGIATIGTLGVTTASIGSLTVTQNISFEKLEVNVGIITNLSTSGIATIGTLGVTGTSTTRNLQVTGVTTVGFITATSLYVGIATIRIVKGDYLDVGIGTITTFTSSYSQIGISTATTFKATDIEATGVTTSPKIVSGNVRISNTANTIDTSSSDLKLDAFTKKVNVVNDLKVDRDTYLVGIATVELGLVPDADVGAYLGQSTKAFSEAYIDGVQIGVGGTTTIDTRGGDLKLDAFTKKVSIENDLYVTRGTYLVGIATVETGLVPNSNGGAYLGQSTNAFSAAYIDQIRIGHTDTITIDTASLDLKLDAFTKKVDVLNDLKVSRNTYLAGIATVETGLVPNSDGGAYLGQSTNAFSGAYIDGVQIGVAASTTIDTRGGDLVLNASTNKVSVTNDLSVGRNLSVTGVSTFSQVINTVIGLVPNSDGGAYLGQSTNAFSGAYIDGVQIGVAASTTIDTRGGDLVLNASTNKVSVSNDLNVTRGTYLTGIATVALGLVPDADVDAYLGQSNKAFEKAYISGVQIGVGGTTTIDTRGGDLILDSFTNNVKVNNNLLLPEKLYVGSDYSTLYVDGLNNKVGIGTSNPTKDFEFKRQNEAEFAIISNTNTAKLTVSSGNTSSYFKINPTTYELGIINDYPGNISNYIHASGVAGINTGNFNWVYAPNNNILMSLTYGGKLGIGKTDPINTFHVVGTSTITSNSYVGNDLYVANNLYFNSLQGTVNANTNVTTGVSTFSTLYLNGGQNILGIGTNNTGGYKFKIQEGLDAYLGTKSVLGTASNSDSIYFANNSSADASLLKVYGGLYVNDLFVTGSSSSNNFLCRSWVNFDGTTSGTFAGGSSTVTRASGVGIATVTTTNNHNLISGNSVYALSGVAVGPYTITEVGSAKTFTIQTVATTALNAVPITFQVSPIRGSGNVSCVTKNGTGDYTMNFIFPMQDANYVVCGLSDDGSNGSTSPSGTFTYNEYYFSFQTVDHSANANYDANYVNIAIIK